MMNDEWCMMNNHSFINDCNIAYETINILVGKKS